MDFVDIRIARTDRAIEQAFMELREKNPLEKIKIKDLCAMACINKSTFYAHYEDIYALANALENKLIESILASVPRTNDSVALHQAETLTRELFHAFMQNQRAWPLFLLQDLPHLLLLSGSLLRKSAYERVQPTQTTRDLKRY